MDAPSCPLPGSALWDSDLVGGLALLAVQPQTQDGGMQARIVAANPALGELLGVEPQVLVGADVQDVLGGTAALEAVAAAWGEAKSAAVELRCAGRLVSLRARRIEDAVCVAVRDQTEHQAAKGRLQRILDAVPAMIAYIDEDERFVFANAAFSRLAGFDQDRIVGRAVVDVIGEQAYSQMLPYIHAVLRRGETPRFMRTHHRPDGSAMYRESTHMPDRDEDGRIVGTIGMSVDLTEMRQAQEEALRGRRQLRAITDNVPAYVVFVDAEGIVRFANRALAEFFGRDVASVEGHPLEALLGPVGMEFYRTHMDLCLVTGLPQRVMRHVQRPDGSDVYLDVTLVPQYDSNGRFEGYCITSRDATEERKREMTLLHASQRDALTGAANRAWFESYLDEITSRDPKAEGSVALAYVDMDHFKAVNDTYGHDCGDAILRAFADRLQSVLRSTDTLVRIGGDEFAIVLEKLQVPQDVHRVGQRIMRALEAPVLHEGREHRLRASVGFSVVGRGEDPRLALGRADRALYEAKARGRGRYVLHEGTSGDAAAPADVEPEPASQSR